MSEYESIRPYSESEAVEAFSRIARHPALPAICKYLFPKQPVNYLSSLMGKVHSIEEFQDVVMGEVVSSVLLKTSEGFTYSGMENILKLKGRKFLAISNHRDIVLDPALILYSMHDSGLPYAELCVGSNLLQGKLIEDLMRSNRMIKVIRGITARELYLSSQLLSKYIRESITSGTSSVWIAQREGRAKDGLDITEQGLLKMFDLSGSGDFVRDFSELNIIPVSISYEIESCDARKARELGAEGIGLCRTEHMFFEADRIAAFREMICADTKEEREAALAKILPYQQNDFEGIYEALEGCPVTIRFLDPPLHEFVPTEEADIEALAGNMGKSVSDIKYVVCNADDVGGKAFHRLEKCIRIV